MPRLDKQMGNSYVLRVAGRVEWVEVEALASDRVAILGLVRALEPLHAMSRVFIAPTRFAAGLPLQSPRSEFVRDADGDDSADRVAVGPNRW